MTTTDQTTRIRELNDLLRQDGTGGQIMITCGLQAMGQDFVTKVMQAVREFDDFNPDNDPYGEHDCAILKVDGHSIMFKTDYYADDMMHGSEDPSNPLITNRVMTVMLSQEY